MYVQKAERKDRTKETGYDQAGLEKQIDELARGKKFENILRS